MRGVVAVLLAAAGVAHADSQVTVTLNQEGEALAGRLGISVPDLIANAHTRIDELYKVSRIDELLRAFANTAAFTHRGHAVDYDVDPNDILVGASAGGVHGDVAIGTTNSLLGGSIINYSAMTGVNLGRWKQPRITLFASGFYNSQTIHGLTGNLLTLSTHAQYQLVPAVARPHMRWTGVAATSGVEYTRLTLGTSSSIESHFTAEGPNGHQTIHMSSTGTLDVLSTTYTIPLEVTTGVRFGALALYAGGGLTITTGSSAITAQLDSVLSINHDHIPVGNAVITGSGENTPSTLGAHAITGLAIHTRYVRFFLQGTFASGETAASLGVRGAF
jgi:hypothetical protein